MKLIAFIPALAAVLLTTTGCCATEPVSSTEEGATYSLLIQGYNYTDQYIDSFTVNGVGGGNVFVSDSGSGGGGSVCCYAFDSQRTLPISIKVKWAASYCLERKTNPYPFGERFFDERKTLWKEAEVEIKDVSLPAKALEVHFYPDGHVEAAVTPGYSPPRLKLPVTADKQRPGASRSYPFCSHEHLDEVR